MLVGHWSECSASELSALDRTSTATLTVIGALGVAIASVSGSVDHEQDGKERAARHTELNREPLLARLFVILPRSNKHRQVTDVAMPLSLVLSLSRNTLGPVS